MFAQRVEVDFGEAFLRQAHVIRTGTQIGQRACRVQRHALWVGVGEFAQFGRGVGGDPAGTGVLAALQAHIA
ncbi:MAG: hypothetical protein RIR68_656, partial [Pseudomonadota bacterium]